MSNKPTKRDKPETCSHVAMSSSPRPYHIIPQGKKAKHTTSKDNVKEHIPCNGQHRSVGVSRWRVESLQAWKGKKTKWINIHTGIDTRTKDIKAVEITDERVHDSKVVRNLLEQVEGDIVCVIGDGAYDKRKVYEDIREISPGAKAVLPPRRNSLICYRKVESSFVHPRDKKLKLIRRSGESKWKEHSGYGVRSRVENVFYRLKRFFDCVRSKLESMHRVELLLWCKVLNMMKGIGRADI